MQSIQHCFVCYHSDYHVEGWYNLTKDHHNIFMTILLPVNRHFDQNLYLQISWHQPKIFIKGHGRKMLYNCSFVFKQKGI